MQSIFISKKKKYAKHLFPHHDYKSFKKKKKKATVCPSDKESIWMCHKCFQELLYNNKLFLNLEVVFG